MNKTLDLTQGDVKSCLLKFTIPILLTILLQTAYGTADLLIVGQFASVADVSGVTIGSQLMAMLTSLFTGLAMGTTILVARHIGSGEERRASQVIGTSLILFTGLALLFTAILLVANDLILSTMNTPAQSLDQAKAYLYICGGGTIFIVFYNLLGSIFRGLGDSNTPLYTVAIATVINIVLDLILVAGFGMGAAGAAIATVTAQGSSVLLSLLIIRRRGTLAFFSKANFHWVGDCARGVVGLGIPVALQGVLVSTSFLAITSIANAFGVAQSAAVGIGEKVCVLVMVVPQAFAQAMAAFAAQNMGAMKLDRAKKALRYSVTFSLMFGCCTAYIAFFHGTLLTSLFTSDPETTVHALLYLKSYAFDCVFVAIMFSMAGYFNGCGNTTFVMFESILGAVFIRIPLAFWLSTWENTNLFYIGMATPSSTVIQIFLCLAFYYRQQRLWREQELI